MARVIKKSNRAPWGDVLGGIGQGLSGFAGGYMGSKQMDLAEQNAAAMRDMYKMWGKNGEGINATPAMQGIGVEPAQAAGSIPGMSAMPAMANAATPVNMDELYRRLGMNGMGW